MDFSAAVKSKDIRQPFEAPYWQGWDHQLVARYEAKKAKRFILSMDKGTGKTSTVLSIFEDPEVHQNKPGFTVLIFTPEKGMAGYERDILKFPDAQDKVALIYGSKAERIKRWKAAGANSRIRYIVLTYASFLSDAGVRGSEEGGLSSAVLPLWVMDGSVDAVVCDEFHRVFRNHSSKIFKLFAKVFRRTEYFIPMSGSAVDKGPQDLWAALHLVDQKFFSSYWKYVGAYCELEENGFGKSILGPRNEEAWRRVVRPYVFHCTADMINDMPPLVRDTLDVDLPPWQKKLEDDLRNQMFAELIGQDEEGLETTEYIFAQNTMVKTFKARLALICPKVLNPQLDYGQGIEDVYQDAFDGGLSRYAIFTPFKAPIPYLKDYLSSKGCRVWVLQGGIGKTEQDRRLYEWRQSLSTAHPDSPSIILGTIKYAESWEIPEARHAYMLGYEFSREDNKQAESRLRRLISEGTSYIHYVKAKKTYDEELLARLIEHKDNYDRLFRSWGEFVRIMSGNNYGNNYN